MGQGATPAFNWVDSDWIVPAVACPVTGVSTALQWAGLGGWTSGGKEPLYQIGTGTDCLPQQTGGSKASYYAWWEMLPKFKSLVVLPVKIDPVHHGDHMLAGVQIDNGRAVMTLEDLGPTWNVAAAPRWKVSVNLAAVQAGFHTVECVVERPLFPGNTPYQPLSNFGTVSFPFIFEPSDFGPQGCLTSYDGNFGPLASGLSGPGLTTLKVTMHSNLHTLAVPSGQADDGHFTVTFKAAK